MCDNSTNVLDTEPKARCQKVSRKKKRFPRFCGFQKIFANYSVEQLNKIREIDLTNYYRNNRDKSIIHCLLCNIDIDKNDTFDHTVSSTHVSNKMFYNFVQKRNRCGDMNFFILNANWLQCRYCDRVIIPKTLDSAQKSDHTWSNMHIERKQYCLNRVTRGHDNPNILQPAAKPQEPAKIDYSCIPRENQTVNRFEVNNEHQFLASTSRVVNEIRKQVTLLELQLQAYKSEVDRYHVSGSQANTSQLYTSQAHTSPVYRPQADISHVYRSQICGSQANTSQADVSRVDRSQIYGSQTDTSQVDVSRVYRSQADVSRVYRSQFYRSQADTPRVDVSRVYRSQANASEFYRSELYRSQMHYRQGQYHPTGFSTPPVYGGYITHARERQEESMIPALICVAICWVIIYWYYLRS